MKHIRCRCAFVAMLVVLTGMVLGESSVAKADDEDCIDRFPEVPIEAYEGATVSLVWPGTGYTSIGTGGVISLLEGTAVAAPIEGAAGGGFGSGTGAAAAAALFASVLGTCAILDNTPAGPVLDSIVGRFWDWKTLDGAYVHTPIVGVDAVTSSQLTRCDDLNSTISLAAMENAACISYSLPWSWASSTRVRSNADATFSVGGNSFPVASYNHLYPQPPNAVYPFASNSRRVFGWPFHTSYPSLAGSTICDYSTGNSNCGVWNSATTVVGLASAYQPASNTGYCEVYDVSSYPGYGQGIGGACGLHPRTTLIAYNGSSVAAVWHQNSRAAAMGWYRLIYTDVLCKNVSTGHTLWVRESSAVYSDRDITSRIPIATCPSGRVPTDMIVQRVPIRYACSMGTICYGNENVIFRVTMPSATVTSGTSPAWVTCLSAGRNCSRPVLDETTDTCTWGGYSAALDLCDSETLDPESIPNLIPQSVGTVPAPGYDPAGVTTADPVSDPGGDDGDPPGGGVTVSVPIDDGGASGRDPGVMAGATDCWPDGWGWFNPKTWVEQPIKCAMEWAFVPSDGFLAEKVDELQESFEEQFPFSMAFLLIDFASDLGDELEDASGTGCFDTSGSLSFGDIGDVAVDDVCIGDGMAVSPGRRQLLAALMITPLLWAVATHAVNMVKSS